MYIYIIYTYPWCIKCYALPYKFRTDQNKLLSKCCQSTGTHVENFHMWVLECVSYNRYSAVVSKYHSEVFSQKVLCFKHKVRLTEVLMCYCS